VLIHKSLDECSKFPKRHLKVDSVVGDAAVADSAAVVVVEIGTAIGADVGFDGVAFVYLLRKLFYLLPKICFNESLITEGCIFAFH